jgi:Ca2+-binding RTX toxin-like protein
VGEYVRASSTEPESPQAGNYVVFRDVIGDAVNIQVGGQLASGAPLLATPGLAGLQIVGGPDKDEVVIAGDASRDIALGDAGRASFLNGIISEIETREHASSEADDEAPMSGKDTLLGGDGRDFLLGGNDHDELFGQEGNDLILGDNGRLSFFAGWLTDFDLLSPEIGGDDLLTGGADDDDLYGQHGNDSYGYGGVNQGRDHLFEADGSGQAPNDAGDRIDFSFFSDAVSFNLEAAGPRTIGDLARGTGVEITLSGPLAFEQVVGSRHDDYLVGNDHANLLDGGAGNDLLRGMKGNDVLIGGDGNDELRGGKGDDILLGGAGDDRLKGQKNDDVLVGGAGHDVLEGNRGYDFLDGGLGNDFVEGGKHRDVILGGDGDDFLDGDRGRDLIDGEAGNDRLRGRRGRDILLGGSGDDELRGGKSSDTLEGGTGLDRLNANRGKNQIEEADQGAGSLDLRAYFEAYTGRHEEQRALYTHDPNEGDPDPQDDRPVRAWLADYLEEIAFYGMGTMSKSSVLESRYATRVLADLEDRDEGGSGSSNAIVTVLLGGQAASPAALDYGVRPRHLARREGDG